MYVWTDWLCQLGWLVYILYDCMIYMYVVWKDGKKVRRLLTFICEIFGEIKQKWWKIGEYCAVLCCAVQVYLTTRVEQ